MWARQGGMREFGPKGRRIWVAPLTLFFIGVLSLIVFSGILNGVERALSQQVLATVFWLLLLAVLGFDAAGIFAQDAHDGTLDQDFLKSGGTYIWLILRTLIQEMVWVFMPALLIFSGLWALGIGGGVPWLSLFGLMVPLGAARLLASAIALGAGQIFAAGNLLFFSLAAPFFFLAVAGRGDLMWAMGLIFAGFSLFLTPFILSLSHRGR